MSGNNENTKLRPFSPVLRVLLSLCFDLHACLSVVDNIFLFCQFALFNKGHWEYN